MIGGGATQSSSHVQSGVQDMIADFFNKTFLFSIFLSDTNIWFISNIVDFFLSVIFFRLFYIKNVFLKNLSSDFVLLFLFL